MKTIYLDNSATTKPSAAVIAAMTDALENGWMRRKPSRMRVKFA